MMPYLETEIATVSTPEEKRALVREYLQMRILQSLQRVGAMVPLAFHGGTALRLLYQMERYSEDLDFALERQRDQYDFHKYLDAIQRDMTATAYTVEIKFNDRKVVNSAFIRFRGLLYQLGLTHRAEEVIAIKLEIDTNPPEDAILDTMLVQNHVDVHVQHHDQASLLAGKLGAILQRQYVKGRDWYDLYWYLSQEDWPLPNLDMLNCSLLQSSWERGLLTEDNWRIYVQERLDSLDWQRVLDDVQRFLIDQSELEHLHPERITELLKR